MRGVSYSPSDRIVEEKKLRSLINRFRRGWYLFSVYTGARACLNIRTAGKQLAQAKGVTKIFSPEIGVKGFGDFVAFIHPRPIPHNGMESRTYGMISFQKRTSPINRVVYWFFLKTSHFGVGHLEIAFYTTNESVYFYGVRNIVKANADRLGMKRYSLGLCVGGLVGESLFIMEATKYFLDCGYRVYFSSVKECIELSVNNRLVHPCSQGRLVYFLGKKYSKLRGLIAQEESSLDYGSQTEVYQSAECQGCSAGGGDAISIDKAAHHAESFNQ